MSQAEGALIIVWLGCFLGAAALSLAEVSIIRVRRSRVVIDAQAGEARAATLLRLIDNLPVVLNAILLLVLMLQVCTATIAGFLAERWFGGLGVTAATVATTAVLFLYAEAIPKTLAIRSPHSAALRVTPMIAAIAAILGPIVRSFVWLADKQTPGIGASLSAFGEEELRALAQEAAEAGTIAKADAELVDRSFEFGDRSVRDVMVPREYISAVEADAVVADVLTTGVSVGHSRLPIYVDGLDHIVGVARLRDIAAASESSPMARVDSIASPVLRVGPEVPIARLLQLMQASQIWLAIVSDRSGRTVGLATIEDLVAELVGEIADDGPLEHEPPGF